MAERPDFRAPKGTQDVLPPESARWEALLGPFASSRGRYGYGLVQSPMFEDIGVFQRIGEGTDVVAKEMYDFEDKGGRHIALRPEGTAPVARAFVEHRPDVPWKVWYATPAFRYERPQAGRSASTTRWASSASARPTPTSTSRSSRSGTRSSPALGLRSGGWSSTPWAPPPTGPPTPRCSQAWLRERAGDLAADDAEKVERHPLRVLDSKRAETRAVLADAPRMADHLDAASVAHGERVQAGLAVARHRRSRSTDPRPRPRLLHPHRSSSSRATPSATPSPRSSAAAATTG